MQRKDHVKTPQGEDGQLPASEETNPVGALIFNFYPPELWEKKNSVFRPQDLWYFIMAALTNSRIRLYIFLLHDAVSHTHLPTMIAKYQHADHIIFLKILKIMTFKI